MADNARDLDPAERLRRLQERRAATGRNPRPGAAANAPASDSPEPDAAPPARPVGAPSRAARQRRPHPAAATRLLLAGLSVASFFAIGGTVAVANLRSVTATTANAAQAATATAATSATPRGAGATNATTQVVPSPHTTSGGS